MRFSSDLISASCSLNSYLMRFTSFPERASSSFSSSEVVVLSVDLESSFFVSVFAELFFVFASAAASSTLAFSAPGASFLGCSGSLSSPFFLPKNPRIGVLAKTDLYWIAIKPMFLCCIAARSIRTAIEQ